MEGNEGIMKLFRLAAEELCRPAAELLSQEFDHYRGIVESAYSGLTPQQAYDLAYYNNLETRDPLDRCPYYRGTDQRDFFIPALKRLFKQLPAEARIGDFGAGDGQTTAMALDALRGKAIIDIIEPSPAIKKYETYIAATENLALGMSIQAPIGKSNASDDLLTIPDNSLDVVLCIHAIYFFDIATGVQSMYRCLKPGASLFVVFADETKGTTGRAVTGYFNRIGRHDVAEEHQAVFNERVRLLSSNSAHRNIVSIIEESYGHSPLLTVEHAPSRFYGDKFGDMAGFGLLTGLPFFEPKDPIFNTEKVLSVLKDLKDYPRDFDLGVVDDPANPRHGMWTTAQPQKIITITKPPGDGS
jgi:SAM-dependent methyltransferase